MKRMLDYNDFLFDKIFESKGITLPIKFSKRLKNLLMSIKNPISKELLRMDRNSFLTDVTYVDYDDSNINNFTYSLSNKIFDYLSKTHNTSDMYNILKLQDYHYINTDIWDKYRASSRVGRFINRVLPGKSEKEIEDFVNIVKLKRTQRFDNFKIVKGDDLLKYYSEHNYSTEKGKSNNLFNSCMRYDRCQDYLQFYIDNNVEMVVLMSDEEKDKILGRALLWKLDKPEGRMFMDRIYYINDYDVENFKEYAKSNKWLYKRSQNRESNELICDSITGECNRMTLVVENIKRSKYFAYLDTLSFYFSEEKTLTNNDGYIDSDERPYYLQSIDGGYMVDNMRFMTYYNRLVSQDDLVWCHLGSAYRLRDDAVYLESSDEYATQEYANEHLVYSEWMERYLDKNHSDTLYIEEYDQYVTDSYADMYLKYSSYVDRWLLEDDAVYSNYHNDYLPKVESIKVITGINPNGKLKFDNRYKNDDTYQEYKKDDEIFYFDEKFDEEKIIKILSEQS